MAMDDDTDRVETAEFDAFAAAIMAAYDAYRGHPYGERTWMGEGVGAYSRNKFRRAADAVLDTVEWVTFGLAPKGDSDGNG